MNVTQGTCLRRRCARLAPLLLVVLLPSCFTMQLWDAGKSHGAEVAVPYALACGALRVADRSDQLIVLDSDGVGRLILASDGRIGTRAAHTLLTNPDYFQDVRAAIKGALVPFEGRRSQVELVLSGHVDSGAQPVALAPGLPAASISLQRSGDLMIHRSTWSLQSIATHNFGPSDARELPTRLDIVVLQRGSPYTSLPTRVTQVVLTPFAIAADIVVTPLLLVYFGYIDKRTFIF